jgi:hypothetical protein
MDKIMQKILALVLLILVLNLSPVKTWAASPALINENQIVLNDDDDRIEILENYFAKYNSPLQKEAKHFVNAADKYDMDWRLVAAISGVESTFGKFTPGYNSYNAWGWGVYGNQCMYFKSWEDGIYTVSSGLKTNYLNKGLTNPYTINRVYAASPTWGSKVTYFLADMDKFIAEYEKSKIKTKAEIGKADTAGKSATIKLSTGS